MEKILSSHFCQPNLFAGSKLHQNMWVFEAHEGSIDNKVDPINV